MIDQMGDKATAKDTMKKAGVPTIPGSDDCWTQQLKEKNLPKKWAIPLC